MSHVPKPGANYISLLQYAKHFNVCYKTAYNRFHKGKIPGAYKSPVDNHVYVPVDILHEKFSKEVTIYATVPSNSVEDMENMEEDIRCMKKYCHTRGWTIVRIVREICNEIVSGFRPKFNDLLADTNVRRLLINKKADVCFYGFEYIKTLLGAQNRSIIVMDKSNEVTDKKRVMREAVNTIYAMCKVISGDNPVSRVDIKKIITRLITNVSI